MSLVLDDWCSRLQLFDRNSLLHDDLDGEGRRCSEVPNLLSILLGLLESFCDGSCIRIVANIAQLEVVRDELGDIPTVKAGLEYVSSAGRDLVPT